MEAIKGPSQLSMIGEHEDESKCERKDTVPDQDSRIQVIEEEKESERKDTSIE